MALSATALVTLEDAKDYLNIVSSADDVAIERLVHAASTFCEKSTGRVFKTRTVTDQVYSGTGGPLLRLKDYPVTSVSAVSFLTSVAPDVWTAQSTTTYPVTITGPNEDTLLYRNLSWEKGAANVRVTYVAGYATVPDQIKEAALQAVAFLWKKKDTIRAGVASQSFEGQTTTYILDMRKAVDMSLLDPYQRYAF